MPKIRQNEEKYAVEGFRKEIRIRQGEHDLMSKTALAEAVDIPRTTITKRLAEPMTMTFWEFRQINNAIHPDPSVVLALLGYSSKEIRKFREDGRVHIAQAV
ncbi:MAG: hypothetical protein IJN67_11845 [Oscillospiraceae bacterium]|nr:hypothetical protein [Oscillospiraceae bacterium]